MYTISSKKKRQFSCDLQLSEKTPHFRHWPPVLHDLKLNTCLLTKPSFIWPQQDKHVSSIFLTLPAVHPSSAYCLVSSSGLMMLDDGCTLMVGRLKQQQKA